MKQQLVISALGNTRPELLQKLTRAIHDSGAAVVDCRMDLLGNETSITILSCGQWDAIAKLEGVLVKLENELDLKILTRRTGKHMPEKQKIPYSIEIITSDRSDVIHEVTDFLATNEVHICEFYTNTYQHPQSDTRLLSLHMIVNVPVDNAISVLRSEFMDFCDRLNLDGILEPIKSM